MSRINDDWYHLPPLQERIIILFGEEGPLTRNEVKGKLGSAIKNILFSFKSLEDKGLIQVVDEKPYRRRTFPIYWHTSTGTAFGLLLGSNPDKIASFVKDRYPQSEEMRLIVALSKAVGKKALGLALRTLLTYPLDKAVSKMALMSLVEPRKLSDKDSLTIAKEVEKSLRPFPKYHAETLDAWESLSPLSKFASEMKKKQGVKP